MGVAHDDPHNPAQRSVFRRRHRISHALDYQRAFKQGQRRTRGPLVVVGVPDDLPYARLGLSVSRRVGGAVVRTRIKRRLREAFRLIRQEMPAGLDLVVSVRPHASLTLEEYQRLLRSGWEGVARAWAERRGGSGDAGGEGSADGR